MSTRPDEGIVAKIATDVCCDYFSVDASAIYEELGLPRRGVFR